MGPLDALTRITTTTTICGTHVHILKGECPVAPGLTIAREPVGLIEKLGAAVRGYSEGQRVGVDVAVEALGAHPRSRPARVSCGRETPC